MPRHRGTCGIAGRILGILCLALPVAAGSAAAGGWSRPEEVSLRERDLLYNDPFSGGFNSRADHFVGRLNDGTQYIISIFHWRYAFWGGWGAAVVIAWPGGGTFAREERIPEESITVARDRFDLQFGDNRLSGSDGEYRIRLSLKGFACDLTMRNLLPPWHPGDGYLLRMEDPGVFMRLGVSSPWAVTSGWMTVGGRRLSAEGQGYGDRSRASYPVSRVTPQVIAIRAFSPAEVKPEDRWFISVLRYQTHEAYGARQVPVMILARAGRWVLATPAVTLTPLEVHPEEGSSLGGHPHRFRVHAREDGYELQGDFSSARLYHLGDIFEKLPAVLRPIASLFFQRPLIFRSTGVFEGTLRLPDGTTHRLRLEGQSEYDILR